MHRFETIAVHAGAEVDPETGAIAAPIHLSTTYEHGAEFVPGSGYLYQRYSNPTQDRLEVALAAIEGGARALAFASGLAAGAAYFQHLPRGSHVLMADDTYFAFRKVAENYFDQWQLDFSTVDMTDLPAVHAAVRRNTAVLWIETPSNPLIKVSDVAALAQIAHAAGAQLVVDATFATPVLLKPLALGADVVLHSTTKYMGGHSDVLGGALIFARDDATVAKIFDLRKLLGGVANPFASWLVLRGLRSLAVRVRAQCVSARCVADWLAAQPRVEAVHYPGLASHPNHAVAAAQMSDFGGMLSFQVRGGRAAAIACAAQLKLFINATSLGGVESLIEHRESVEGAGTPTPDNLLRVSIGLEHIDDLIADLAQALASL